MDLTEAPYRTDTHTGPKKPLEWLIGPVGCRALDRELRAAAVAENRSGRRRVSAPGAGHVEHLRDRGEHAPPALRDRVVRNFAFECRDLGLDPAAVELGAETREHRLCVDQVLLSRG